MGKILSVILTVPYIIVKKIMFPRNFTFEGFIKIETGVTVRITSGGKIHIGSGVSARKRFSLNSAGGNICLGKNSFFNNDCSISSMELISIGENTLFGENVKIYDHNHLYNTNYEVERLKFKTKKVIIGRNCWVGSNSVILGGVEICDNVIIGASTVVNESITSPGVYINKRGLYRVG